MNNLPPIEDRYFSTLREFIEAMRLPDDAYLGHRKGNIDIAHAINNSELIYREWGRMTDEQRMEVYGQQCPFAWGIMINMVSSFLSLLNRAYESGAITEEDYREWIWQLSEDEGKRLNAGEKVTADRYD